MSSSLSRQVARPALKIGIDVGGTHTDAVLMSGNQVLAGVKRSTTADVVAGISAGIRGVLDKSGAEPTAIRAVMIGTTHFTNAVVEARGLMPVAVVRLALPATAALPPLIDWPERLRAATLGATYLCRGGHEFDGRVISPLDHAELDRAADDIAARGLRAIAISAVFSPINAECEREAADFFAQRLPGVSISLSSEIGRIGLLERENATVINASLTGLTGPMTEAFRGSLKESGIVAPLYLSQNDGTLMSVDHAARYPVTTFASGPTNSMRGAALLSGLTDCAVVDVGGTTSDIGMLIDAFPREASTNVEIGRVRTNFRMPDVLSLGIGGGSHVRWDNDAIAVGPTSVGYRLTEEARVFGGKTLTATDIAVAARLAEVGDPTRVANIAPARVRATLEHIDEQIGDAVDRMKTRSGDIPVVAVGGGSVLLRDQLPGASQVLRPENYAVANAVGAAIAEIGGEVDRMFSIGPNMSREHAIELAKEGAAERARIAGATPDSIRIVDVEEMSIAYVPGNAVRIKAKAVGSLEIGRAACA